MPIYEKLRALNSKIEFKVAVILTIIGFFVTNVVTFEGLRVHDLESTLAAEQLAHEDALRHKDININNVLPANLAAPLPTYPDDNASLLGRYVRVQWHEGKDQMAARAYTLELIKPLHSGAPDFEHPQELQATDPEGSSSTLVLEEHASGTYLWRVRRGRHDERPASWSSYFRFRIYPSSIDRISQTGELRVGTFLPTEAETVACTGVAEREMVITQLKFDNTVMNTVCSQLAAKLGFSVIRFVRYPSADALVYAGVKDGNVDLAVSALSATESRKHRGVRFSREYLANHVVVARSTKEQSELGDFARVGVVRGGTNAEFARELQRHRLISIVEAGSIEELLRLLETKEVSIIIVDEPIIDVQVNQTHELVVAEHLTTGITGLINRLSLGPVVADAQEGMAVAVHEKALEEDVNTVLTSEVRKKIRETVHMD
jgi:ABC-type amino acid transport substrate-binding protein